MAQDFARAFYDSTAWRKTRVAFLTSKNYVCENCGGAACTVHHVKHIKPHNINNVNITLHWDNLKAVCEDCHALEHSKDIKHRGKPVHNNGIAFDDEGNVIKCADVFIVYGSPASGKTTYVLDNKTDKDLVVDLDYICAALMCDVDGLHKDHTTVLDVALEVKDLLYKVIQSRSGRWERAFVTVSSTNYAEVRRIAKELNAEVIVIDTPLEECVKRIKQDPSRISQRKELIKAVRKWHSENKNAVAGNLIPPL